MRYNWEGPASLAAGVVPAIQQGFQAGRRTAALTRYQTDPQAGINALMPVDPELAMHMQGSIDQRARLAAQDARLARTEAAKTAEEQLERHRGRILDGAKLIKQFQPRDQAGWQQVLAAMQQYGHDISDIPPNFDPAYVDGVSRIGEAMSPASRPTALQQNYEYLQANNPQLAETYLRNQAEGAPVVFDINGDGAPDLVPRSHFNRGAQSAPSSPPPPGTVEDGYRFKGGNPADPANWEEVGGAGRGGPQTFP